MHRTDIAVALAITVGAACHVKGGGGSGPVFLTEREPNDDQWTADPVGFVAPGDLWRLRGHVSDFGADRVDRFAFTADRVGDVELWLAADAPFADLDLFVYDPALDLEVLAFLSPHDPEVGTFSIVVPHTDFQVVVRSFAGTTGYTLEVRGHDLGTTAPAASAAGTGRAGPFASGDALVEPGGLREAAARPGAPARLRHHFPAPVRAADDAPAEPSQQGWVVVTAADGATEVRGFVRSRDAVLLEPEPR